MPLMMRHAAALRFIRHMATWRRHGALPLLTLRCLYAAMRFHAFRRADIDTLYYICAIFHSRRQRRLCYDVTPLIRVRLMPFFAPCLLPLDAADAAAAMPACRYVATVYAALRRYGEPQPLLRHYVILRLLLLPPADYHVDFRASAAMAFEAPCFFSRWLMPRYAHLLIRYGAIIIGLRRQPRAATLRLLLLAMLLRRYRALALRLRAQRGYSAIATRRACARARSAI